MATTATTSIRKPLAQWEHQSARWRSDLGISPAFKPWTGRADFQGLGVSRQKRTLDLVDCAWVQAYKRAKITSSEAAIQANVQRSLLVDTSQNHVRKPLSSADGFLGTLLTSSDLYHYGEDRSLLPVEHLLLQGYDPEIVVPDGVSPSDVRAMAGEAVCLPCLATVLWCLHVTKDLTSL